MEASITRRRVPLALLVLFCIGAAMLATRGRVQDTATDARMSLVEQESAAIARDQQRALHGGGMQMQASVNDQVVECKAGYAAIRSRRNNKYLWTHDPGSPGSIAASAVEQTPICMRAFEVKPVGGSCAAGGGFVTLTTVDSGRILRGTTNQQRPSLALFMDNSGTAISNVHHFQIEAAGYIYHKDSGAFINIVPRVTVRLHKNGAPQIPAEREISAHLDVEWLDEAAVASCQVHLDKEKDRDEDHDKRLIERIHQFPESKERRYISFGLYGKNPKYTEGAIRNAELAPTYFPGWKLRFYARDDVPADIIARLKSFPYVEIVTPQVPRNIEGASAGMFWRFTIADDPTVDRYIVRDSDSRLNSRDRLAIEEWIESGKGAHVLRDHVNHCREMNGGMWGAKHGAVRNMQQKLKSWVQSATYGADQNFLSAFVWPDIRDDHFAHDSYCCRKFQDTHGFPTKRPRNYQHVGQVFDARDNPRMSDIDGLIRGVQTPPQCRRNVRWLYG